MIYHPGRYIELLQWSNDPLPDLIALKDHLGGFSQDKKNVIFDILNRIAIGQNNTVVIDYHQILENKVKEQYCNLDIKFNAESQNKFNFQSLKQYNIHPELTFKNFICSFNGTPHVSRKLLASILKKFNWFDPVYCSKNFSFTADTISGHIGDYFTDNQLQLHEKFFLTDDEFCQQVYSFGHDRFNHHQNIYKLESKLTDSFLHVVSETMATSYCPFVTEKFLYSIVTRGLFLVYGQPGWHDHIENYYGFKRYTKLFDYNFDSIQNPIERLVALMCMISKFSKLSTHEWHDLYLMESETIEYNYDWYFSKSYVTQLQQFSF
jgi:hypothetical protein